MDNIQYITPPTTPRNDRMHEFDALRGFSMLSVVFVHALNCTGISAGEMVSGAFVISFFMPLFFFISGFFAYKPLDEWTYTTYKRQIPQKIKALIICTFVFYTFRYYLLGVDLFGWLHNGFMGYWFTIVLFDMFAIYYVVTIIAHLFNRDFIIPVMIVLGLAGPILIQLGYAYADTIGTIFGVTNLCFYLQWFVLGLVIRRYYKKFECIVLNKYVSAFLFISYIIGLCGFHNNLPPVVAKVVDSIIVPYIGVITITSLFFSFRNFFVGTSKIGRALCFVGKRTLDIYMLHYFFLPSLPMLGSWLVPNSMILFQLVYGLGIAVLITAICLLLSSCLRTNPILADWLFGVKPQKIICLK